MNIFTAVLFTAVAMSFGWGMRGLLIGGEKGAMLPGALLGLCFSRFVSPGLPDADVLFAAVGALSMSFGGIDPYGETMGFVLHPERPGYGAGARHGYAGIFIKGGVWFGIADAFLCLVPSFCEGGTKRTAAAVFFALLPLVSAIGRKLFNSPYDKTEKVFPKAYFSLGSREEWGGNVLILLCTAVFAAVTRNYAALLACPAGFLSGGAGFCLGLRLYRLIITKKLLKKLSEKRLCDGWKVMEHVFGAFAGGCSMLFFLLTQNFRPDFFISSGDADFSATARTVCLTLCAALLCLTALREPLSRVYREAKGKDFDDHLGDVLERPLYSAFPLALICFGGADAAFPVLLAYLPYTIYEKAVLEKREKKPSAYAIFSSLWLGVSLVITFLTVTGALPLPSRAFLGAAFTLPFALAGCFNAFRPDGFRAIRAGKKASEVFDSNLTVQPHFVVLSVMITAVFFL